jgi:hypothetical protein
MAYTVKTKSGHNLHNVNFSVGNQAVNKRDDVMLVQWLLHRVYKDRKWPPVGGLPMAIDGWIGTQTKNWITDFQRRMKADGESCHIDGKVDAARQQTSTATKTVYTIVWMNSCLLGRNQKASADPASDPECPPELRRALKTGTGDAGPWEYHPDRPNQFPGGDGGMPWLR